MPDRRELLAGGLAVTALGISEYLRPRDHVRLMPSGELAGMIPDRIPGWTIFAGGNVVEPVTPNSLSDQLYSAVETRTYLPQAPQRPPVMLLVAYGGDQSDMLQLHRPEACYPAVGARIVEHGFGKVPLRGRQVPATYLTASHSDMLEDIVYFTRLGEALPLTAAEQRRDRLRQAMAGVTGDGILVRASCIRPFDRAEWGYLARFLESLMQELRPDVLRGFVGSRFAANA